MMSGSALIKFWLDKRVSRKRSAGLSAVISLFLFAISSTAIAGPSAEDIDFSYFLKFEMENALIL